MSEAIYDELIAPKLAEVAKLCMEHKLSIVAVVEYAPGERGETRALQPDAGLGMVVVSHAAKCGENIDGLVIGMKRYAQANGIKTDSSIVLTRLSPPI